MACTEGKEDVPGTTVFSEKNTEEKKTKKSKTPLAARLQKEESQRVCSYMHVPVRILKMCLLMIAL